MTSRFRLLRRLLHMKIHYHHTNVVKFPRFPQKGALPCTLGFSILTLIGLEKKLSPEDELILTIKHCVLFMQRQQFDKAERLSHVALRQAQTMGHQSGITYIYDVMANLYFEQEQYEKAKKLFVTVTQRIMTDGVSENDPKVIHISLKLARISHMQKEYTTAQLGFEWCLEKLYTVIKNEPSENNKKLLAMTEDWYGRLFLECNKTEAALTYMEKAYNHMTELTDIEPADLAIQLNDMGTVCDRLGATEQSVQYFLRAIEMGKKEDDMNDLGSFYVNLGRAYLKQRMIDEARKSCGYGWKLGVLSKNEEIKNEAQLCMKEIKNFS